MRRLHLPTLLLMSSMFASGACGLVIEYVLATVATYILGNSLEQFGVVIGLMLFMMGVAGAVQRVFSDKRLVTLFILIEVALALLGGYAPLATYWAYGWLNDHFFVVQYFFIMAIGFLIGLEIPVILRINDTYGKTLSLNISQVFSADYLGSLAGALLWVYFLVRHFPLTEISFMLAGVNFAIAMVAFAYFARQGLLPRRPLVFLLLAATAAAVIYGYAANRGWQMRLIQRLYEDPVVFSETTRYQHLVMTRNKRLNEYRFYINGNLQFSSRDEARYHEPLVHPVMALTPDHERVLILGGGDGLALREVLKYQTVREVRLVDLDPDMIRVSATHPVLRQLNGGAFDNARVTVGAGEGVSGHGRRTLWQETGRENRSGRSETVPTASVEILALDADRFLSEVPGHWNVILVDLPDPSSPELTKLYSLEFYLKLKRTLSERGMAAIQATSPYHAKESFLCIRRTLEAAGFATLPFHVNVPSFGDWGWLLAWKDRRPAAAFVRQAEHLTFPEPLRFLTPEVFRSALVFGRGALESPRTDINTLMHPVLLDDYLRESWLAE